MISRNYLELYGGGGEVKAFSTPSSLKNPPIDMLHFHYEHIQFIANKCPYLTLT